MDPAINPTVWGILVVLSALVIGGLLFVVWKVAVPPPEDPNKEAGEKQGRKQRRRQDAEEDEAAVCGLSKSAHNLGGATQRKKWDGQNERSQKASSC